MLYFPYSTGNRALTNTYNTPLVSLIPSITPGVIIQRLRPYFHNTILRSFVLAGQDFVDAIFEMKFFYLEGFENTFFVNTVGTFTFLVQDSHCNIFLNNQLTF